MQATVSYNAPAGARNTITAPTTLTSTETDLFVITDPNFLKKSQLTVYGTVTLGAVASATFYYYMSPDNGTTWFPISLYSTTTGEMTRKSVLVDSGTGTFPTTGAYRFIDNVPLGATTQFKVRGKSDSGTPAYTLTVMFRDN